MEGIPLLKVNWLLMSITSTEHLHGNPHISIWVDNWVLESSQADISNYPTHTAHFCLSPLLYPLFGLRLLLFRLLPILFLFVFRIRKFAIFDWAIQKAKGHRWCSFHTWLQEKGLSQRSLFLTTDPRALDWKSEGLETTDLSLILEFLPSVSLDFHFSHKLGIKKPTSLDCWTLNKNI